MTRPGDGRGRRAAALGACAALLAVFGGLSYSAVRGKSATFDEPLHAVAGVVHLALGDFRMNPEDPPLFGYWGALAPGARALALNTGLPSWAGMLDDFATDQWLFAYATLYRTAGNDPEAFLQAVRAMYVLVGVALGLLIAWWAWRLAGPGAAVVATALFALDPNFMAHAALVKNDVMLSLALVALAVAVWAFGRRGTWSGLAGIALASAMAVNVKFSGILAGPIAVVALLVRAALPEPWVVLGQTLRRRRTRALVAPAVGLAVAIASWAAIWACYGFRFAPTHDPTLLLNTPRLLERVRHNRAVAQTSAAAPTGADRESPVRVPEADRPAAVRVPEADRQAPVRMPEADRQPLGPLAEGVVWAESHRLLPQAWLHGFLFTHAMTLTRPAFLDGELTTRGWWYYFPRAMRLKTPTATLLAIPLAAAGLAIVWATGLPAPASARAPAWDWVCLGLPAAMYASAAMTTGVNIGLRHILPVYPFLFVGLGVTAARCLRGHARAAAAAALIVIAGLAAESAAAYPHLIPFFNALSGGPRAGLGLLGDSNLDWGQDLKVLAAWQARHADRPLYLAYFGIADPARHGVQAIHLPFEAGGWPFAESARYPVERGYLAISATTLQGMYVRSPDARALYRELRSQRPVAVLGHSIYIYEWPVVRKAT